MIPAATLFKKRQMTLGRCDCRLLNRKKKDPCRSQACLSNMKAPSPSLDPYCFRFMFFFKISLSCYEGLCCQIVSFCPFCMHGEPHLSLHLLFWPFGSLKEKFPFRSSCWSFLLPCRVRRREFSPSFKCFLTGTDKSARRWGLLKKEKIN